MNHFYILPYHLLFFLIIPWRGENREEKKPFVTKKLIVCVCSVAQLCPTLYNPLDCSPPGSSVHGISQARILEWVAISCIYTHTCTHIYAYTYIHIHAVNICLLQGRKIRGQTGSVQFNSVAQSCPTLCDLMNCNTPGLPVHHQLPEFIQTLVH